MIAYCDGPASPKFWPLTFDGSCSFEELSSYPGISKEMAKAAQFAHSGSSVAWGIPFEIERPIALTKDPLALNIAPTKAHWFVFLHTSDIRPLAADQHGSFSPMRGEGPLGEHAADYILVYEDGTEERVPIRRRHQLGSFRHRWGEMCTEAVTAVKPRPLATLSSSQPKSFEYSDRYGSKQGWEEREWGIRQTQVFVEEGIAWDNYLWALENPQPEKVVQSLRFEPISGSLVISGISAGNTRAMPLRWATRKKALLKLPPGVTFDDSLDARGLLTQVQLDLGQVISAEPRLVYPQEEWEITRQNLQPHRKSDEIIIEYASHPDAEFLLFGNRRVSVGELEECVDDADSSMKSVRPANKRVILRVVEAGTNTLIPVKLHVHGHQGEYLAPIERNRKPNPGWFQCYSNEFYHGDHLCTYISGQTVIHLPLGNIYLEITKGFEVKPTRRTFEVTPETEQITVEMEKVLHWREKGWVTADTHVHFLSPSTAMLEGAGEGVNVINLLASQWGELMTNVGDFDGRTTFGTKAAGGDGEFLVRVGTENRQHVLGHISLLGYSGDMILPLCCGGADESAIGDPVDIALTEWARQCRTQGGLVVLPHFPDPRLENAATIIMEEADAVEMCSLTDLYKGIDPYSLSDWYRYLNNGYLIPAVAGTDKMSARFAVGTIRTYAKIRSGHEFSYLTWMDAVRAGHTFVTYGPLLDFHVGGSPMGSRVKLNASGGTLDVSWQIASVTVPMTTVQLIVNGVVRESRTVRPDQDIGSWSVRADESCWLALLVRAKYDDKPEMIAAHSSPVIVDVDGSQLFAAADAVTILEQIEGSMAYIDTIATRADAKRFKEMRMIFQSAHRRLHNRMHEMGVGHQHNFATHHPDHD
ncbi:conserved hypothetical protein [Mesorhizobium plurifarium]|uniref:Uncharacterized protein n=1 Tax=Mesorhizobium plurifarium TaxID=69974 RepID=A0A0K2VU82_MESPL|nr:conserved hypothetical protein [Mesorhizobium plurifarium]